MAGRLGHHLGRTPVQVPCELRSARVMLPLSRLGSPVTSRRRDPRPLRRWPVMAGCWYVLTYIHARIWISSVMRIFRLGSIGAEKELPLLS